MQCITLSEDAQNAHLLNLPGVEGAGISLLICAIGGGVLKVIVLRASNIQLTLNAMRKVDIADICCRV